MMHPKWRLFRQDAGRAAGPPGWLYVALFALCSAIGDWTGARYGAVVFWPANGVLLAALLQLHRRRAIAVMGACFLINLVGNFTREGPAYMGVVFAVLNQAEVLLAGVIARRFCGASLDLRRPGRLARFTFGAVAPAAALSALIGVLALHHPWSEFPVNFQTWFTVDAFGMLVVAPALLLLARTHRFERTFERSGEAKPLEKAALAGLLALVTLAVFSQAAAPVLFLIFLPLLLIAFRLPPHWSAMSVIGVVFVAAGATLNGYGPITLSRLGPHDWPQAATLQVLQVLPVLQMFTLAVLAVALPASTVLTERRRLEARLAARTEAAVRARIQAERAAEAKSRFLSMMSHELRTPLNGVAGFAELLAARPCLDAEACEQVELIRRSSDGLLRLVEDILDFSRGDAAPVDAPFRIAAAIDDVAREAEAEARSKGLWLAVSDEIDPEALHLGDERRLRQVLRVLLSNAVKFTASGGVELEAEASEFGVEIHVADTGCGLDDEVMALLFEPFAQGDASTMRAHEGAGVGLALAKRLVETMGGAIGARNRPGGGAIFSVELPFARVEEPRVPAASKPDTQRPARVLVVDDHPVNRKLAGLMLTALGCEVAEAADGAEAVEQVKASAFDVVLMDVRMPGMDGLEATRRIRALKGPAAQTAIVAVTADAMPEDVARCIEAGMSGHLSKPLNQARLAETLGEAMGAERPAARRERRRPRRSAAA
jgi:signal transduction histidine kinase/AmiR/NasT family two-component response regulator